MKKTILIVAAAALVVCIVLVSFLVPAREQVDAAHSAVMVSKETGELQHTILQIDGQWSQGRFLQDSASFSGVIAVDALKYTQNDQWEQKLELHAAADACYMQGGLSYKSADGELESAVIYTNTDKTIFVMIDPDYIVYAPAESEEDAIKICKDLGMKYFE